MTHTIFFGLCIGAAIALAALGLSIAYRASGAVNAAHGELVLYGAYAAYAAQLAWPSAAGTPLVALVLAFSIAAALGIVLELAVVHPLRARPLDALIATLGASLLLRAALRAVAGETERVVALPQWLDGAWQITPDLSFPRAQVYVLAVTWVAFAALVVLAATGAGRRLFGADARGELAHRDGAPRATPRMETLAFGFGAGLAGIAGVALVTLTGSVPSEGLPIFAAAFVVMAFGGAGSVRGVVAGGLAIGVATELVRPAYGTPAALAVVLAALLLFLQKRPHGPFAPRGRSAAS